MISSKPKPFNPIKSFLTSVKGLFAFSKKICYNDYRKCEKERSDSMDLYQLLSKEEQDTMVNYIAEYGPLHSSERPMAPLKDILSYWSDAKSKYLIKIFNGSLILERELEYETPVEEMVENFRKEYKPKTRSNNMVFYDELYRLFWTHEEFSSFRFDRQNYSNGRHGESTYNYLSYPGTLMKNSWELPECYMPLPDGKSFKVCPGTKITRIFGRLAKAWSLRGWEEVREAHAKATTTKRTKGTLCLSIHPMDYITMSDNNENWHTCMEWRNRREYRAGTVEMMNSPCVVVAYLKHPTHTVFDGGWNSKLWRELFIVDKRVITNIKAYPYENPWLSRYIATWLKELAETAGFSQYIDECFTYSDNDHTTSQWLIDHKVNINLYTGSAMYNDCGRVDQYMYLQEHSRYEFSLCYSGERICMNCGLTESECNFESENEVFCSSCEHVERYYCEECGECIQCEDEVYTIGDQCYCYSCWNSLGAVPYDRDETMYIADLTKIYLYLPNGEYSPAYLYVHDVDYFLDHFIDHEPDELPALFYDEENHFHYLPYGYASVDMKWDCGLIQRDQILYDNWNKTPEERKALLEEYDDSHRYYYSRSSSSLSW